MTLPLGRAKLGTKFAPTGSPAAAITMGRTVVSVFAAIAASVPETTIKSTFWRTTSAASPFLSKDALTAHIRVLREHFIMFTTILSRSRIFKARPVKELSRKHQTTE